METVRALMSGIKEPQHYDKVYKDECVFTFDTPFSPQGLLLGTRRAPFNGILCELCAT